MAITRIATTRKTTKDYAVVVETDVDEYKLTAADLTTYDTVAKVKAELERQANVAKDSLPPIFVHRNRDGSGVER